LTETSIQERFQDLLRRIQRPARLTGGEWGSGPGFQADAVELRVVLTYPDVYEIGISNQAMQILYGLAKGTDGVAVERAYLPWVDAIAEMRSADIPLLTLESWMPVSSADLVGVTVQHESNYTNLLELLDLAGLAIRSVERGADDPLVVIGGPACANFSPLTPFVDAVVVGDGEEVFVEILSALRGAASADAGREQKLRSLSALPGVFVPGISERVVRRAVARLDEAPYPESCLVPLTEGVHDRAWVEVMRGCTRGCRFCQAGMWYRPVRERSVKKVVEMTEAQLTATGYQEVAFASLSTTDFTGLGPLVAEMQRSMPEVRVSLPSLRVDSAAVKLAGMASPTGPSLTLAPEAGSQRMRDIMNKNVSEADILGAVEEAVRAGKTTLKLYFMIGLPGETDEDASAIGELCNTMRDHARRQMGTRANRLQLNVSVNNFIPKPFTPFQWAGMADRETLLRRQGLIRDRLRRAGMRVSFSRPENGYLEAALARGGEEMADVVEAAWRQGALLDAWSDRFRAGAWGDALAAKGRSAEELATACLPRSAVLPWHVIGGVVDEDFLWQEWERALQAVSTPDCRWSDCWACGACGDSLKNDLASRGQGGLGSRSDLTRDEAGTESGKSAWAAKTETSQRWRYVAKFGVTGKGSLLGHLDRAEIFRRAVRRAGGRLALSQGMRPKALLGLAMPLPVGVEGMAELADFQLSSPAADDFGERLGKALPEGMDLVGLAPHSGRRSLASRVVAASYEIAVAGWAESSAMEELDASHAADITERLKGAANAFAGCERLLVEEEHKKGMRQVDVRQYVDSIDVCGTGAKGLAIAFTTTVGPTGTVKPEAVLEAVGRLSGLDLRYGRVVRTRLHLAPED